jgi:HSP20 family molecular chaperone IbpA
MLSTLTLLNDPLWNELDRTLAAFGRVPVRGRAPHTHRRPPSAGGSALWARKTADGVSYVVCVDLPGVRAEGLTVEIEGRHLAVAGKRADDRGVYRHSLTLPTDADAANASADLSDGVLTLTVPRRAEDQPRLLRFTVAGELPPAPVAGADEEAEGEVEASGEATA